MNLDRTNDTAVAECDSWLCRDGMDRERMLDMDQRLMPVRRAALGVLALALIASGPWIGYWTLVPLVVAGGFFGLADRLVHSVRRPEFVIFAAWAASEVTIAVAVALTGGPQTAALSWLAIPVVTLSARFPARGVVAGVLVAIGMVLAVGLITDPAAVGDDPTLLIAPIALIIAVAMLSTALMESDLEHRSGARVDSLTGMLTRYALSDRVDELTHQSHLTQEPVGLIVGDLDNLKRVNDTAGHTAGDQALQTASEAIRSQLRAFDLAYRIGGDEFLVILPGADLDQAEEMAERLCRAVARSRNGGAPVTMSFGVDASGGAEGFDYDFAFEAADAALIAAKRRGGNRVLASAFPEASLPV